MSLVIGIGLNGFRPDLGLITIQRISGTADPDSVNTYRYEIHNHNAFVASGEIEHRYGDGALALLAKVCREADL